MKIQLQDGLPIVSFSLAYKEKLIRLDDVLLDTGCTTTIFDTDEVEEVGLSEQCQALFASKLIFRVNLFKFSL